VRKTDLNGSFRVRGMSPVLAEGFCRGNEFLYVRVEVAPGHEELI
jgi:crossover junction endodeoxyribonuclease RusA